MSSRTARQAINEAGFLCSKPRHAQLVRNVNKDKIQLHEWGAISRRGKSALTIFEGIMGSNFCLNENFEKI
jgi:hypothetical protein